MPPARLAIIVAASLLSLAPSGAAADRSGARQPSEAVRKAREAGRGLYMDHCASCHGASGRGNGPAADSLRRTPTDLTGFSRANGGVFPSARLREVIDGRGVGAHGSVEMPVWGSVFKAATGTEQATRDRIDAILSYLQSLQERAGHNR